MALEILEIYLVILGQTIATEIETEIVDLIRILMCLVVARLRDIEAGRPSVIEEDRELLSAGGEMIPTQEHVRRHEDFHLDATNVYGLPFDDGQGRLTAADEVLHHPNDHVIPPLIVALLRLNGNA